MYCIFNGHRLDTGNYETNSIELNAPSIRLNKYELARYDGVIITNKQYGERTIKISGRILANNLIEAEERLDTLNSYLNDSNKELIVEIAGATRKFDATLSSFVVNKTGYSFNWIATFVSNSIGENPDTTTLTFGTYSSSSTSYVNTISGSYKAEPVIDMTVNKIDPFWEYAYLDIYNAARNERLRITRIWNWFDRVVVDGSAKTVSLYATTKTVIDTCDSTTGWTSTHTLSADTTNMKEGDGCLKVVMAGAAATTDFIRLNNSTTIDISASAGYIIIPLFIPTPTVGAVASVSFYGGKNATLAADYDYWTVSTQWDGSAIATNAWNFLKVDLSTAPTGTNGTPDRTLVKSLKVVINGTAATMQLNGALLDYLTIQKAGITSSSIDYEGTFPYLDIGSTTLVISDELTSRNITITGYYTKRYL